MLLSTYHKLLNYFKEQHGYASFADLRSQGFTMTQLNELQQSGELERISRGLYWCHSCGFSKPDDYRYIEIAKINPDAIICLNSACYLNGMIEQEPEIVDVATARDDRKLMHTNFPIKRHYFSLLSDYQNPKANTDIICERVTDFGFYRYFSKEQTLKDCIRLIGKVNQDVLIAIEQGNINPGKQQKRMKAYYEKMSK